MKWNRFEIVSVVATFLVLIGLVTFNLNLANTRARDAQRKADLSRLQGLIHAAVDKSEATDYAEFYNIDWQKKLIDMKLLEGSVVTDPLVKEGWADYRLIIEENKENGKIIGCIELKTDTDGKSNESLCKSGNVYTLELKKI